MIEASTQAAVAQSEYVDVVFNLPAPRPFTYVRGGASTARTGCRIVAPFGKRELTGFVVSEHNDKPQGGYTLRAVKRVVDAEPLFGAEYLDLAQWVAGMYMCSLGEALATMLPGGRRESKIPVLLDEDTADAERHELAPQQRAAVDAILSEQRGVCYIHGVTGSGKTEVYLTSAESVIAAGRSVIYLVPEISLTHQLIEVVRRRFHGAVAVLHSGLTPSQKLVEWTRIMHGEATLVVGARSAVFAPVQNLGLVIIDEEHEGSFKSGTTPRYHARQVAMRRCAVDGARLVMGSATPSVEAHHLAEGGRLRNVEMPERLSGGRFPEITLVDMKHEGGALSRRLAEEMRAAAAEGRQTILFLNRRGFSYFFHCRSCGFELTCNRCSVSMTYHKERNRMICHYCGFTKVPVSVCPDCGSLDVGYSGFGTELVEEEVRRLFPDLSIARVDTDSTKRKGSLRGTLDAFRSGEIQILLGTQMVAKGLNFPGVKLVGIVLADTGLHLPDFRAAERTFSLIVQVAGRAGRYLPDGRVIVQTYRPEADAIRLAAGMNLPEFYRRELAARKELDFPPFARLIRLVARGRDDARVRSCLTELSAALAEHGDASIEVLGPAECPLSVIAHNHRRHIIVRTHRFSAAHRFVAGALARFTAPSGVYLEVDVDPVSLL